MPAKPITERIETCLHFLRKARADSDPGREMNWTRLLDELLDRYLTGER